MTALRSGLIAFLTLLLVWQAIVWLAAPPSFILPPPSVAAAEFWRLRELILENALSTALAMSLGLILGAGLGSAAALAMTASPLVRAGLSPLLIASQAIPVFAIAPLLVLWLGYDLAPKIAMAALVVLFPVATSFHDALRRTPAALLEAAKLMSGDSFAARLRVLVHVRLPAALPGLATGLRTGAGVAAIAAVIGEWVGSGSGLGYLMLWANGRAQTGLLFASLATLFVLSLAFYALVDALSRRMTPWMNSN